MNERRIMLSVWVFGLYISGNNGVKWFFLLLLYFVVVVVVVFGGGGGGRGGHI